MDYQKGKIYKIVSNTTNECYVGSTRQKYLSDRLASHKTEFKRYNEGKHNNYCTSFKIIETGDYEIVLVEKYPCDDKDELHARERWHIENTENCVNHYRPGMIKAVGGRNGYNALQYQKHKEKRHIRKYERCRSKKKALDLRFQVTQTPFVTLKRLKCRFNQIKIGVAFFDSLDFSKSKNKKKEMAFSTHQKSFCFLDALDLQFQSNQFCFDCLTWMKQQIKKKKNDLSFKSNS